MQTAFSVLFSSIWFNGHPSTNMKVMLLWEKNIK